MQYGNSIVMKSLLRSPLATPGRVSICLFLWQVHEIMELFSEMRFCCSAR